jgi:hypothetical protein
MPRDEIVEAMAKARYDYLNSLDNSPDVPRHDWEKMDERQKDSTRDMTRFMLAALIEACPLVAGLIDDPEGIAGAVDRMVSAIDDLITNRPDIDWTSTTLAAVDRVSAWMAGAGGEKGSSLDQP